MEAAIQDFTHKCFWNMNLKHLYCRQNEMLEMIALETSYKVKLQLQKFILLTFTIWKEPFQHMVKIQFMICL